MPPLRPVPTDHTFRLALTNINGLRFWFHKNYKTEQLRFMLKMHKVDAMGLQESCINWSAFKSSKTLALLLRQGVNNIRSVHSKNTRPEEVENVDCNQRRGTSTMLCGKLFNHYKDLGKDHTGLGRWSWYLVEGEPGHRTRFVSAYAPTGSEASEEPLYWKQSMRYINKKGFNSNPKAMF